MSGLWMAISGRHDMAMSKNFQAEATWKFPSNLGSTIASISPASSFFLTQECMWLGFSGVPLIAG